MEKKWTRQPHYWNLALNQFSIMSKDDCPRDPDRAYPEFRTGSFATSSTTASVTVEIRLGEISVP